MASIAEALSLALQHHQAGHLPEAEALYRQILQVQPNHPGALHLLGVIAHQKGQNDLAIENIRKAISFNGAVAEFHLNLGNALHYRGALSEAVECYRRALALKPGYAEAYNNMGNVLHAQGKLDEAAGAYRQAVALNPAYAEAHNNLGITLRGQGALEESLICCRRALALKPEFAGAHNSLGNVLNDQGKLDEAMACYRRALTLNPNYVEAHNNLGNVLKEQGKREEAVACYQRALALQPTYAEAHNNLGLVLEEQGRVEEAVACYRQALALKPAYAEVENQLMHQLQHLCEWSQFEELIERQKQHLCTASHARVPPFTFLCIPGSPAEQLRAAQNWAANRLAPIVRLGESLGFRFTRTAKPKLRVGYLSRDFHQHPTAYLIAELFELHDRTCFEVFAYSYGPDDGGVMRQRLVKACDRFRDTASASFEESARRIYEDGIDILIDLKGYTHQARTQIAALRPAPIQVNYLGYPGTMGAAFIDYIITDRFITPPGQEPFFSEQLVYLPDCYQINDRKRQIAEKTLTREEVGLPQDGFVLCCFNNTYKITPGIFAIWMRVLKEIPGSVLWLLETNRTAVANLRREATVRGVNPDRLVFAPRVSLDQHLARLRLADLHLDTLPYNAHTTASDALWAGLPVLTCAGETFASRVAGSLLTAIGLSELITYSLVEYEARTLQLAGNPTELARLRKRLAKNRLTTPLFDSARFTRHLEMAYQMMWDIYAKGKTPRRIEVPALRFTPKGR